MGQGLQSAAPLRPSACLDSHARSRPAVDPGTASAGRGAPRERRIHVLGLPLDLCGSLALALDTVEAKLESGEGFLTTFVNPAAVVLARRDVGFARALPRFDMVLPDGIGLVHAVSRLRGERPARVSFDSTSLALPVFSLAERTARTVALVGGAPSVAERAASRLRRSFPDLRLVATADGFGDVAEKAERLRALAPDIVVCGMGGGAQEEFLLALSESGWRGCGFTCGGYLDQLGTGLQYYPAWIDRMNLRWAYRLALEPRRLWRRYLIEYSFFGLLFLRAWLGQGLLPRIAEAPEPA